MLVDFATGRITDFEGTFEWNLPIGVQDLLSVFFGLHEAVVNKIVVLGC